MNAGNAQRLVFSISTPSSALYHAVVVSYSSVRSRSNSATLYFSSYSVVATIYLLQCTLDLRHLAFNRVSIFSFAFFLSFICLSSSLFLIIIFFFYWYIHAHTNSALVTSQAHCLSLFPMGSQPELAQNYYYPRFF